MAAHGLKNCVSQRLKYRDPKLKIAQAAARHHINVVVGVNERNPNGIATLYNTLVTISDEGKILGRHRKLVPTWAEKADVGER